VLALPVWTPGRIPRGFQAPPTGSYQEYGGSPAATSAAGLVRAARPISAAASASRVLRAAPVGILADEIWNLMSRIDLRALIEQASSAARPEPHDRTTRYDQGPVAAPSRRFSFCLSSRARVLIPVLIHPSAASSWSRTQVLYTITKHAMRRSADEIGATSISFRPKVFSDPGSVVD
jgi:hypothetical protein